MINRKTLLVVEDDTGLQQALRWSFDGFDVVTAGDRKSAVAMLRKHRPQVITLDLGLPPDPGGAEEGLAALEEILAIAPLSKVIVLTGNNDRNNALRAVGLGAWLFCHKPVDANLLGFTVDRAYRLHELERENRALSEQQSRDGQTPLVATSPQMLQVCGTVEKVAATDATVLLLGESGTGKEVIARALHERSNRSSGPFVAINCAAIPETLLESELFGYEKGAFTGAVRRTLGNLEYADGGTLLLDEIGDLSPALQAKLLRFLQERVIVRIGGREEIPVNVRVICATHQDLGALIDQGRFRDDLYYRVSEISIRIPPLRERDGEAVVLARHFLAQQAARYGRAGLSFTQEALSAIGTYRWSGNVRELENKVKRAVIMAEGSKITTDDLELQPAQDNPMPFDLRRVREYAESHALLRALNHVDGNISQAAELLGIARPTFYALLNKYGLKTQSGPRQEATTANGVGS